MIMTTKRIPTSFFISRAVLCWGYRDPSTDAPSNSSTRILSSVVERRLLKTKVGVFNSPRMLSCSLSSVGRAPEYRTGRRVDTTIVLPEVGLCVITHSWFKSPRELLSRSSSEEEGSNPLARATRYPLGGRGVRIPPPAFSTSAVSSGPRGQGRALTSVRGRVVRSPHRALTRTGSSTSRATAPKHQVLRISLVRREREVWCAVPTLSIVANPYHRRFDGMALQHGSVAQ